MDRKHFVIAIDGPAGAGKSTIAKRVANELGFLYVDSGAMYRAVTLKAMRKGVPFDDKSALIACARRATIELLQAPDGCKVLLDGEDVGNAIRTEDVSKNTGPVASTLEIREILWDMQRNYRKEHDIVMEGRDIGSKVFPDAQMKIFLDASVAERAQRRFLQLQQQGLPADLAGIEQEIAARDERDRQRSIAPLLRLPDARYLDTTGLTMDDEVARIVAWYRSMKENAG